MHTTNFLVALLALIVFTSCKHEPQPTVITETGPRPPAAEVVPVNINHEGFDLLENMQGQWTGSNRVIATDYDWFSFDYRAVSPSHVFGIFEGGSMGNLFTSFFVTDYKNTRTIMARNGGLLNGIYRTSYFVLDSVSYDNNESFYRLIDAVGGTNIMWMELRFKSDSLYFNAYTSRLGLMYPPTRHMSFRAVRNESALAQAAASAVGFPENTPAWDFSAGFNHLYAEPGEQPQSATYLWEGDEDVWELAEQSGDPFIISDIPHLATLTVNIDQHAGIENAELQLYLSKEPLTDAIGQMSANENNWNTIQLFPTLTAGTESFLVTYLHPGTYYLTVVADVNANQYPGEGDITHPQQTITVEPGGQQEVTISNITIQN